MRRQNSLLPFVSFLFLCHQLIEGILQGRCRKDICLRPSSLRYRLSALVRCDMPRFCLQRRLRLRLLRLRGRTRALPASISSQRRFLFSLVIPLCIGFILFLSSGLVDHLGIISRHIWSHSLQEDSRDPSRLCAHVDGAWHRSDAGGWEAVCPLRWRCGKGGASRTSCRGRSREGLRPQGCAGIVGRIGRAQDGELCSQHVSPLCAAAAVHEEASDMLIECRLLVLYLLLKC
mmetsp:Transcript_18758/g.45158  ORF Transcript_18758/g.45158 Transcript_18758/m.45158 type:complete len:232 (-) Transcript_18758:87-782(-)